MEEELGCRVFRPERLAQWLSLNCCVFLLSHVSRMAGCTNSGTPLYSRPIEGCRADNKVYIRTYVRYHMRGTLNL